MMYLTSTAHGHVKYGWQTIARKTIWQKTIALHTMKYDVYVVLDAT